MLRALRTSVMALAIRRCIAMVLTLCVCVAFAEPGLADSCDADATASRIQSATAQAGVSEAQAFPTDAPTALVSEATRPRSSTPTPVGATHDIHVCHCVHAHVAPLGRSLMLTTVPTYLVMVRAIESDRTPPSVVQEPQLRPPRTLSVG